MSRGITAKRRAATTPHSVGDVWLGGLRNSLLLVGIGKAIVIIVGAVMISRDPASGAGAVSGNKNMSSTLTLNTSAFENGQAIPSEYTCDGDNVSPLLAIAGVPEGAKSLALIMDDPDVPTQLKPDGVFDHWTLFNIAPETREIPRTVRRGTVGANGSGQSAYTGRALPRNMNRASTGIFQALCT